MSVCPLGLCVQAEVASEEEVMAARPDMEAVAQLPVVGVILTARTRRHSSSTPPDATSQDGTLAAGSQWAEELRRADFVARFFGPQVGVVEVRCCKPVVASGCGATQGR